MVGVVVRQMDLAAGFTLDDLGRNDLDADEGDLVVLLMAFIKRLPGSDTGTAHPGVELFCGASLEQVNAAAAREVPESIAVPDPETTHGQTERAWSNGARFGWARHALPLRKPAERRRIAES